MAGPLNESEADRLALSNELLKIKGMPSDSVIDKIDSAIFKL